MAGKRITGAEVERRVVTVHNLLLAGAQRKEILQFVAKQNWDVQTRQIDEYIAKAKEEWKQSSAVDKAEQLGLALAQLDQLYKNAMTDKDWRTALAIRKEKTAMLGLAEAANINLNVDFGDRQEAMDRWGASIDEMINKAKPADAPPDE